MPADKKLLMAIMAKPKPKPEEEPSEDTGSGLETAMDEFLSAVEAGDAAGMAQAFRSAMDMCNSAEE
jgi:hypothetical protein